MSWHDHFLKLIALGKVVYCWKVVTSHIIDWLTTFHQNIAHFHLKIHLHYWWLSLGWKCGEFLCVMGKIIRSGVSHIICKWMALYLHVHTGFLGKGVLLCWFCSEKCLNSWANQTNADVNRFLNFFYSNSREWKRRKIDYNQTKNSQTGKAMVNANLKLPANGRTTK